MDLDTRVTAGECDYAPILFPPAPGRRPGGDVSVYVPAAGQPSPPRPGTTATSGPGWTTTPTTSPSRSPLAPTVR